MPTLSHCFRGLGVPTLGARLALSTLALGLAGAIPAQADVKYTTVMSIMQEDKFKPMNTTTTYLKDGLERVDSKQDLGVIKMSESTITSAAKRNRITFDPELHIYVVEPFGANGMPIAPSAPGMPGAKPASTGGGGTGKIAMTFATKFVGLEKLMNYQTRHNVTNATMDLSGCCGTGQTKFKTEDWRADIKLPAFAYPHDDYSGYGGSGGSDCKVSFERKGDMAAYNAAQKGLALKTIMFDPQTGKPITSSQITMLSFAALSDSDFAVPDGFKQLSRAEYDKQKQKAMMANIMKNAQGGQDDGSTSEGTTVPAAGEDTPTTETPGTDTDDAGKDAAQAAAKKKGKKKFKLPF